MKNRLIEFDLMKGIGILLVILGHSVPDFPLNLRADNASRLIEEVVYGFHMPLFFVCSGFVMQMSEHKPNGGGEFFKPC